MALVEIFLRTVLAILCVIVVVRLVGLRAFSKMSSFDFALTIAMGSLLATTIIDVDMPLLHGLVALISVFSVQAAIALFRQRVGRAENLIDNTPLLLMKKGEMLPGNLAQARVTRDDILTKLREANALDLSKVQAVVLETTGSISVLYGDDAEAADLEHLLSTVNRNAEPLRREEQR